MMRDWNDPTWVRQAIAGVLDAILDDTRPIAREFLWDDFYQFTVGQFFFHRFPEVEGCYAMKNRTKSVRLAAIIPEDEYRRELDAIRDVRFAFADRAYRAYLAGLRFVAGRVAFAPGAMTNRNVFAVDYLEFLEGLRLPAYELTLEDGEYALRFPGKVAEALYWETRALRVTNALRVRAHFRALPRKEALAALVAAFRKFTRKIARLSAEEAMHFVEFGTRRAAHPAWHEFLVAYLADTVDRSVCLGTSNVHLARKFGLTPFGTMSHQVDMLAMGVYWDEDERAGRNVSHAMILDEWLDEYHGELATALTDTFTTKFFFDSLTKDQAEKLKGFRQDSGDVYTRLALFARRLRKLGIDPKQKRAMASDGLFPRRMIALTRRFRDTFAMLVHGWGTNGTFDIPGIDPISIVVKLVMAAGHELVKISDNPKKVTGSPEALARAKRLAGVRGEGRSEVCRY